MTLKLGQLQRLKDIRQVWPNEAKDFTPWLAQPDNIALLSIALHKAEDWLEVKEVEASVGSFRADIVCQETDNSGRTVLIENQFGPTDHDHLGKLLTYAAGHEATVLIWLAETIREEHEAAIDFINTHASDALEVFGVELEVLRIGDSALAPRFNVIAKPNSWSRTRKLQTRVQSQSLGESGQFYLDYWSAFCDALSARGRPVSPVSPQPQNWLAHGIGKTGVGLNLTCSLKDGWVRVEIYLAGKTAKAYFAQLNHAKDEIEQEIGSGLEWQELPEKTDARICLYLNGIDPRDQGDWPRQHGWLLDQMETFHAAFHGRVKRLIKDPAIGGGEVMTDV